MVISVFSDIIPVPRSADKTTPHDGVRQYGNPPSKYDPTRHMYDSTHDGGFDLEAI
jgi:hypothetical protein